MDNYSHSQEIYHLKGEIKLGQKIDGQYCIAAMDQSDTFIDLWVDRDILKLETILPTHAFYYGMPRKE